MLYIFKQILLSISDILDLILNNFKFSDLGSIFFILQESSTFFVLVRCFRSWANRETTPFEEKPTTMCKGLRPLCQALVHYYNKTKQKSGLHLLNQILDSSREKNSLPQLKHLTFVYIIKKRFDVIYIIFHVYYGYRVPHQNRLRLLFNSLVDTEALLKLFY